MRKIAFVLYTQGLEYDDRVRKESLSLSKYATIDIFTLTPKNIEETGITSYGIEYRAFSLKSRKIIPSGKFTFLKSLEFYFRVKKYLKSYDIIWVCDEEPFLIPLFYRNKKIIWDQHELPMRFEKNRLMKILLLRIENRVYRIIHANQQRRDYLLVKRLFRKSQKHLVLHNYPDMNFIESNKTDSKYDEFIGWLNGSDYVYLQGLSTPDRYPVESIESVLRTGSLKGVVIGSFDANSKEYLSKKYGNTLSQRIFFCGRIDQLMIPNYIRNSKFSIILYELKNPNNRLCEPNRMYQSIVLGKPVVVGCNVTMKDVVEKYCFGVVINSDGKNVTDIISAIDILNRKYKLMIESIKLNKNKVIWSEQEYLFKELMFNL